MATRNIENRKEIVNNIKLQLYSQFLNYDIFNTTEFMKLFVILKLFEEYGRERTETIHFKFMNNIGYIEINLKNNVNISPHIKIHINKIR